MALGERGGGAHVSVMTCAERAGATPKSRKLSDALPKLWIPSIVL